MNINKLSTEQQQKERLITAYKSGKLTDSAKHKIKVMLENGDLWHQVSELNDLLHEQANG